MADKISKGTDIVFATLESVRKVVAERQHIRLVWPEEGEFVKGGFKFNAEHHDFQPLILDTMTANMLCKVHEAVKPEPQAKVTEWIQRSRGHFAKIVQIGWGGVK